MQRNLDRAGLGDIVPHCWRNKPTGTTDVFGRLWWDRPAYTIRTEFYKPEKGRYLHPTAHRPITVREAARCMTLPGRLRAARAPVDDLGREADRQRRAHRRNTKAKRELGWKTTPHEDTLESTVNWYLEREGDRIARARRTQPYPYKAAAIGVGLVERMGRA